MIRTDGAYGQRVLMMNTGVLTDGIHSVQFIFNCIALLTTGIVAK